MTKISFIGDAFARSNKNLQPTFVDLVLAHMGYELAVEGRAGATVYDRLVDAKQAIELNSSWIIVFHPCQDSTPKEVFQEHQQRLKDYLMQYPYVKTLHCVDSRSENIEFSHTNTTILAMLHNPKLRLYVGWDEYPNAICYAGNVQAAKQIIRFIDTEKDRII